jgi:hypothetical protein
MTTDLIEELQTFGGDFTHCALLVRHGSSTVAIFADQVDSAISRRGVPVGFVGVDVDAETISVHTRPLGPAADTDWDIKLFARWSDLFAKTGE